MALSAGTRFGSYEIVDEIGTGGIGVVYLSGERYNALDAAERNTIGVDDYGV